MIAAFLEVITLKRLKSGISKQSNNTLNDLSPREPEKTKLWDLFRQSMRTECCTIEFCFKI